MRQAFRERYFGSVKLSTAKAHSSKALTASPTFPSPIANLGPWDQSLGPAYRIVVESNASVIAQVSLCLHTDH